MGRGTLPMDLIPNEKSRSTTFHKRKRGLTKKLEEFTTLCDVQACMIVYGPHHDDGRPMELDVWPPDNSKVKKVIKRYQFQGPDEKPRQIQDLQFFFEKRKEKVNEDIVKMRRANTKAKYPCRDVRIDLASAEELCRILETVDDRLYRAGLYSELLKENQRSRPLMITNGAFGMATRTQNNAMFNMHGEGLYHMNLPLDALSDHRLDQKALEHYTFGQRPFDFNFTPNATQSTMRMNDEYQYGSSSDTSHHNYQYNNPSNTPTFYEQNAGFLESLMFNNNINPRTTPLMYYSHPSTQQVHQHQPFSQRQLMIPVNSSQVNTSQLNENHLGVQVEQATRLVPS